jgi:hypothetical protein
MYRNTKKTRNKLKTDLNELVFCWKRREAHANADTHISNFNFDVELVNLGGLEGKTLATKPSRFFCLGSRNYDFSLFPLYFFFFCHIQTFFYTIMNIFITLLENVNKSRN